MATKKEEKEPKFTVIAPFQDKFDSNIQYAPKQDVSHLDAERLESLVKRYLVKAE